MVKINLATSSVDSFYKLDKNLANVNFDVIDDGQNLVYAETHEQALSVNIVNLNTGKSQLVDSLPLTIESNEFIQIREIVHNQTANISYFHLRHYRNGNTQTEQDLIYAYDFDASTYTLVFDENETGKQPLNLNAMAVMGDDLLISYYDGTTVNLAKVSGANNVFSVLHEDMTLSLNKLTLNAAQTKAIVVNDRQYHIINLADGTFETIEKSLENDFGIENLQSFVFDEKNNRLLTSDIYSDQIISLDLESKSHQIFMRDGIGQGPVLYYPRELVIDKNIDVAYVADTDNNLNSYKEIIAIDLSSGDRRLVDFSDHFGREAVIDITITEDGKTLYVLHETGVSQVDLNTSSYSVVIDFKTSLSFSSGYLSGMSYNNQDHHLYLSSRDAVFKIDLSTNQAAIVSSFNSDIGTGEKIDAATAIELDEKANRAFIASQYMGAIFTVDLETGARERLVDSCIHYDEEFLMEEHTGLFNMHYEDGKLFVMGDLIFEINPTTKECQSGGLRAELDLDTDSKGQFYMTGFGSLKAIDHRAPSQIIISK